MFTRAFTWLTLAALVSYDIAPAFADVQPPVPLPPQTAVPAPVVPPPGATTTPVPAAGPTPKKPERFDRRVVRACLNVWVWWDSRPGKKLLRYRAATRREIASYFPNYATMRDSPSGKIINYTEEEAQAFREAVALYFNWNIRRRKESDKIRFRQWLIDNHGGPHPALEASTIKKWADQGLSLKDVMNRLHDNYENSLYLAGRMTKEEQEDYVRRFNWKMLGHLGFKWTINLAFVTPLKLLYTHWKTATISAIVGTGAFVISDTVKRTLPENYLIDEKALKERIKLNTQDREKLYSHLQTFLGTVSGHAKANYSEKGHPSEQWTHHKAAIDKQLIDLAREARKLNLELPLPDKIKEARRFETHFKDQLQEYEILTEIYNATEVNLREWNEKYPDRRSASPEEIKKREQLIEKLRVTDQRRDISRRLLVELLAGWKILVTHRRVLHASSVDTPGAKKPGPASLPKSNPEYESDNEKIDKHVERLQELELFGHFVGAYNNIMGQWGDELQKKYKYEPPKK